MKPLACFAVPWCTGAIMLFNKHIYKKMIMQKIDKKLCIVYKEAIYQSRTIQVVRQAKKILDYLTCSDQAHAAEFRNRYIARNRDHLKIPECGVALSAFLGLASSVQQHCRTG